MVVGHGEQPVGVAEDVLVESGQEQRLGRRPADGTDLVGHAGTPVAGYGGAVGLGVGSLIGNGNGRDVAQVLGTIGGAVIGNEVQKRNDRPLPGQQIIVRMSNGVLVSVTQASTSGLHVGQRVYIQGSGENARVTPQ